jgi:cell division protein FtsL
MEARLAEEQIFNRKKAPLIYLVKRQDRTGIEKVIHSRSGLFYVMVVIVVFFSLGLLLNIGLKIQSLNLERKILETNEMLSTEKERTDRILLKVSELKSPSRIIELAAGDFGMQISDKISFMKINGVASIAGANPLSTADGHGNTDTKISGEAAAYDSLLGTIYNIKDILMVVSEGVLTFFIP